MDITKYRRSSAIIPAGHFGFYLGEINGIYVSIYRKLQSGFEAIRLIHELLLVVSCISNLAKQFLC